MQNELIELNDREIDGVAGGLTISGGNAFNLSGSEGKGSVSIALFGQSASFGGQNTVAVGVLAGPTTITL
jgi:hypothetical protein